jgi:hypothetical protein
VETPELPTPEQEHRVVGEVTELWRRYKLLRQHARNNGQVQNAKFHYRSCCRTLLRQIRAVVRQTWAAEKPVYIHYLSRDITTPVKSAFPYAKGWTPPPYRSEDHDHVGIITTSQDEARRYWEWLDRQGAAL